ncbi:S-locus lectin protein kinase family protein, putative [Theobroma cacao]|uniref:S-locus lectin protein kinase family protein, putative n=1 Tax=Theobroma cacao TaxID=3641 RepID=A0A061GPJ5_THECC|nr:S-locus lectin protein kinase family protein, putative [Theobroma cacao]
MSGNTPVGLSQTRTNMAYFLKLHRENEQEVPLFSFASIETATNYFGCKQAWVNWQQGQEIAVKRLSKISRRGITEFKNEITLKCKLQRRNLARLLGSCIGAEEGLLVYEYMPNNSLDSFIFDSTKGALLDWRKCVNIIQGIAQGLLYLHSGYMSSEYAMDDLFLKKLDVFSFEIIILEIVSAKENIAFFETDHSLNLLGRAWDLCKQDRCMDLIRFNVARFLVRKPRSSYCSARALT